MTSPAWDEMSAADFDKTRADRRHKRAADDQGSLFYVPTPERERTGREREELPGQVDIFGNVAP